MSNLHKLFRCLSNSWITKKSFYCSTYRSYSDAAACVDEKSSLLLPSSKVPPRLPSRKKQNYDFFLVLDFEATCDSPETLVPQEVIEFPVLKVNGTTFETDSIFHSYVRPIIHPKLTKFCSQLTGITQEVVDSQPVFEDVYESFQRWMQAENLLDPGVRIVVATCGDWDLKYLFPSQCKGLRLPIPEYMRKWINIKVSFSDLSGMYPRNMVTMMKYCTLQHEGKLHSGLDDCKNIARVLKDLADRGTVYDVNAGFS